MAATAPEPIDGYGMFLRPGEEGRRSPYCSAACCDLILEDGSRPSGDDCEFAPSGFLERRLHAWKFRDLEAYLIHPHDADARGVIESVTDLKSNGQYESYVAQLFDDPSFYNGTDNRLAITSFFGNPFFRCYRGTYGYGNALTLKNKDWDITVPENDTSLDLTQRLLGSPFYESYEFVPGTIAHLIPKDIKEAIGATFRNGRVKTDLGPAGVLAAFGHSAKTPGDFNNLGSASRSGRRLLVDSGASIHAVGEYTLLRDVQLFTTPMWAKLPDGSELRTVGIGQMEWEHFSIPNVYLVEGFQKSLISVSQLDRDHGMSTCFGKGTCEIMLPDGITRAGGGILEGDGMYVLRFLEVPKPAQE